ncbi:MAG: hypothetical protein ACXABY_11190 [Candidatus Thorarchaeota archaeon]|jgi:hypothetical protein
MEVVYKLWESGQELEDAQAKIYTEVSGIPANAEEIGPRNDERGTDASRYAFTKDGEPLAYITSLVSDETIGRIHIGYPWSLPNCPVEVKDKLLNDLITYWKGQEKTQLIRTSVVLASKTKDAQIEFFEKRGFTEDEKAYRYTKDFNVEKASKLKLSGPESELKCRTASESDLDSLIELTKSDPLMSTAFPNDDAYTPYFKDKVLKDGHAVILYDGDKVVAASAPLLFKPDGRILEGDEERVIMRFTSIRPGYGYAWARLLVEVAKEAKEAGWKEHSLRSVFGFMSRGAVVSGMTRIEPELEEVEVFFRLTENER